MATVFNVKEILKIAVDVETNGKLFYQKMAESTQDEEQAKVLNFLAKAETQHVVFFQETYDFIKDVECSDLDACSECDAYLNALASEFIITPQLISDRTEKGFSGIRDVLDFAMQLEKNSILTYSGLKDVLVGEHQELIDKIINEEKSHLAAIVKLKNSID